MSSHVAFLSFVHEFTVLENLLVLDFALSTKVSIGDKSSLTPCSFFITPNVIPETLYFFFFFLSLSLFFSFFFFLSITFFLLLPEIPSPITFDAG